MANKKPNISKRMSRDLADMFIGGTSAVLASVVTNPLEVVKVRLQLQGEMKKRGEHTIIYRNVVHAMFTILRKEGIFALQNGLPAMQGFQFFLNSFRLGILRISERNGYLDNGRGGNSLPLVALASGVGGAIGSILGTPFFLVKTRLQSKAAMEIAVGHQHQHTGTFEALYKIYKTEGFRGLFRGVQPQILRGAVGSSSQMMSFTFAKDKLRQYNLFQDSPLTLSFFGANLGGLVMVFCLNPFDVVATRLSNQGVDSQKRGLLYSGMIDCFTKMLKKEGLYSLYKGWWPNYLRLGPHTVMLLVCWDQLKILEAKYRGEKPS